MKDNMNKYGLLGRTNNQMTLLLNRIERQLGLSVLPLPDGLKKDDWAAIISEDTLPTWSQYFPYKITEIIYPEWEKDGWLFIDKNLPEGTRILGIQDVAWEAYRSRSDGSYDAYGIMRYAVDYMSREYALDDVFMTQAGTDLISIFSAGLSCYIEYLPPNKCKLVSVNGNRISRFNPFPLNIFIEHVSLATISPTMMESFTKLAKCDVATAIYQVLKYYDNMDTTFSTLSLQLDTLQEWANKRDDVIRELDEAHLTTANADQPLIMTV